MGEKLSKTRWHSCTVLQAGLDSRQLWAFSAGKRGFTLNQEGSIPVGLPLPEKLVAKDWKTLFQPRLNVALLPAEKAFLRVIQLPISPFDETLAMVELQLEKISPLPVAQIVWTIQVLPQQVDNLQTVIVVIVARELVDEHVGGLEKQGYLPDRLEVPMLDQLQATPITGDGAWVYPAEAVDKFSALVAWWYGGVLRSLGLVHVPLAQNRGELLEEQLKQMTWAGELEGWLASPPRWHLVATEAVARLWQPLFFSWLGQQVDVEPPLTTGELATLTANRAASADSRASLLPQEYTNRYHQEFVDGLWIRGLGSVLGVYVLAVLVYFAALGVQTFRTSQVEAELRGISGSYTNAMQLKAKIDVLQSRQALKYAFLDCWKVTAELLPEDVILQTLDFRGGNSLSFSGVAPADESSRITDFNDLLRKATLHDQPLFSRIEPPQSRVVGANQLSWNFSGELAHGEGQ